MFSSKGYYDAAIPGTWSWVDCEQDDTFGAGNWQMGAPSNDDNHCAYISAGSGQFTDDHCSNNRSYVCELTLKSESHYHTFFDAPFCRSSPIECGNRVVPVLNLWEIQILGGNGVNSCSCP